MIVLPDVRRYAVAGLRHRWKVLATVWLVCLVGWGVVASLPNRYQSSTRVYADADAVLGQLLRGIAVDASPANQVELLQRTLLSRPNLERVVARTDLADQVTSAASRERLLIKLAKEIQIGAQARNLFTITYSAGSAHLARDVVQAVLNLFMEQASSTDREAMENARTFVAQQIGAYETQLREAERRRAEFRARYVDLLPSDTLGGATRLDAARTRLMQLRGELLDARTRRDLLREQLGAAPATLTAVETAGGMVVVGGDLRVAEAERVLRELRLRFTEQHPDVIAARAALSEIRSLASTAGRGAANPRTLAARSNPVHEQLKIRLVDAETAIISLERQVRDEEAEVQRLDTLARTMPQLQAESMNLDRDYSVLQKSYQELLERRESVHIAGAARTTADRVRLEIVDPPTMPTLPVAPKRLLLAAGVLIAGLGAGGLLAFAMVQLDGSFYTLRDLRQLGLPVLGGISPVQQPDMTASIVGFAAGIALLLGAFGAGAVGGSAIASAVAPLLDHISPLMARVLT